MTDQTKPADAKLDQMLDLFGWHYSETEAGKEAAEARAAIHAYADRLRCESAAPSEPSGRVALPEKARAGIEVLHTVVESLLTTSRYVDEEGEATMALADLSGCIADPPFTLAAHAAPAEPTMSKSMMKRMAHAPVASPTPAPAMDVCPLCKKPAAMLFEYTEPGEELGTRHCGCLHARALLASPTPAPEASPQPTDDALIDDEHIDAVIACLGDDAATLRAGNDECEIAENMDAAATLIAALRSRLASPSQPLVPLTEEQIDAEINKRPGIAYNHPVAFYAGIKFAERHYGIVAGKDGAK